MCEHAKLAYRVNYPLVINKGGELLSDKGRVDKFVVKSDTVQSVIR